MCERIKRTDSRYDSWFDDQKINIPAEVAGFRETEINPILTRIREDMSIIFNAMPERYRDFLKTHSKGLTAEEFSRETHGNRAKLYCPITDHGSRPIEVWVRHDYYFRPSGTSNDSRYVEFKAVFEDSEEDIRDGMRIKEDVHLKIIDADNSELVNEISVEIGEDFENENKSHVVLCIHESGEVELYVHGVNFEKVVAEIAERFPELGEVVKPTSYFHKPRFVGQEASWKLSIPLEQAKAFRNSVRKQIFYKIEDFEA